jgi:hypothetical protein
MDEETDNYEMPRVHEELDERHFVLFREAGLTPIAVSFREARKAYRKLRQVYDDVPARKSPRTRTLRNIPSGKDSCPTNSSVSDQRGNNGMPAVTSQRDSFIFSQNERKFSLRVHMYVYQHITCGLAYS